MKDAKEKKNIHAKDAAKAAKYLLDFLAMSPTQFHVTANALALLQEQDFQVLRERDIWKLKRGGRYVVVRQDSALIAFVVGAKAPEVSGFRLVGAHTDSPGLFLKPQAAYNRAGYRMLGVEVYGSPILATWFDRDLSLAGRVVVKSEKGGVTTRLFDCKRPLVLLPNVAIHLNREVNEKGHLVNRQQHLPVILAEGADAGGASESMLRRILAAEAGCKPTDLLSYDAYCYDTQQGVFSGADGEFIVASKLDNQEMCVAALRAVSKAADQKCETTLVAALFDNEEVGSESVAGAAGTFLGDVLERIVVASGGGRQEYLAAIARSAMASADNAHGVHPNYVGQHDDQHAPLLNGGPVIKVNANKRYMTDGVTHALFAQACTAAEVPYQHFVSRSDLPCGSTIGPISATKLGIATVDVGNPTWAMHSIRETGGTRDVLYMQEALRAWFLGNFSAN